MRVIFNLLIIVLALTSCTKQPEESSSLGADGSGKNEGVISFRPSTQDATTYVWAGQETALHYLRVYMKYTLNDGTTVYSRLFDGKFAASNNFSHTIKYGNDPKDPKQGSTATLYFLGNGTDALVRGFKDPKAPTEEEFKALQFKDSIYTINPDPNSLSQDALQLNGVFKEGLVATRKFDIKLTSGPINSADDTQNPDIKGGVVALKRPMARIFVEVEPQGDQPGDLTTLLNYRITFGKVAGSADYWDPVPVTPDADSPVGTYLIRGNRTGQFDNTEAVGYLYPANNVVVRITSPDGTKTIEKTIPQVEANKTYKITIKPAQTEQGDKYVVVVVAGQSNAVGYDRSGYNAATDAPDPRAFQLSYRRGAKPNQNLSVIPLTHNADNIDPGAIKGVHLPLAKELLKYVPAGYKVLVIPVAYTSSEFGTRRNLPFGTYNTATLAPNEMAQPLRWRKGCPYAQTIIDRTKYVMEKFPASKFLGIVWCQGEDDKANSDVHYPAFTSFAEDVLDRLKDLGPKTAYGVVDKRLWFTYSSCIYWGSWYKDGDATGVFGGYKYWNPNCFIHILETEANSNPTDKYHYGLNAFARVVAPLVVQRMNDNGALFNGVTGVNDHFTDKTTPAEAAAKGGSMTDQDITSSLQLFMSFRNTATEKLVGSAVITNNTLNVVDAQGLKDINGNPRSSKALRVEADKMMKFISGPTVDSWSVSFLAKRYGNNSGNIHAIITNGTGANSPFIGFKKYSPTTGMAGRAEFLMEPLTTTVKENALPGLFMNADNVRDIDSWIHYVVTFDNATKLASVYMNGELVQQATIRTAAATSFSSLMIGNASTALPGAEVNLIDFGIWSKVLSQATVTKLFLMSYYDYTK